MSRDFIFRIKPGQPLPAVDPSGHRVLLDDSTGQIKLLGSNGSINNLVVESNATQTTTINISSAQILNMGSNPVELLPAPDTNKYYDIEKIIIEASQVTTAYVYGAELPCIYIGGVALNLDQQKLNCSNPKAVQIVRDMNLTQLGAADYYKMGVIDLENPVTLSTYNGTNPTNGDGTFRVKITYSILTFGS
jgi:hypothetical protein